jgi:hypothetical protein
MRDQIRLSLALLAASLLVGAGEIEEFFPIRVGASWTYHISKERTTNLAERPVEERITGQSVERVVKPSDEFSYGAPVYILSQHITEENRTTGRKSVVTLESHVSAEPHQVLLHGQVIRGASGMETKLTRFEPPVALLRLPIPAPGEPFPSTMRSHGMTVDSRPYEQADETLKTQAGEFRCLRISSHGPLTGELAGTAPIRITTGSVEETSWFARGVGLVKQVQVLSMNLELPNGVKAKSEERKVKELSDFVVPGSSSNSGLRISVQGLRKNPNLVPSHRLNVFVGRIPVGIHSYQHSSGGKIDTSTSHELRVDSFVFGDFENLVAERILADRRDQRRGGTKLHEVSGDVERRTAGMPPGGQTVPENFAKSVEFGVHKAKRLRLAHFD